MVSSEEGIIGGSNVYRKITSIAKAILPRYAINFLRQRIGRSVNINTSGYWNNVWKKEGLDGRGIGSTLIMEIARLVPLGSAVLDVGCGNGRLLRDLKKKRCTCVGLDISDSVILMLEKVGIKGICSKLPDIPCPSNYFDVVIAAEVLEHLDNPGDTIKEMSRVVKPDGLIIFSVPDGNIWGWGGGSMCTYLMPTIVCRFSDHL